jgi:MoaA/NifB/PqqE/SkfB family radical SAM enzyme
LARIVARRGEPGNRVFGREHEFWAGEYNGTEKEEARAGQVAGGFRPVLVFRRCMSGRGGLGMRYDIEADFILLRTCNYRCDYCFVPGARLGEKIVVHAPPAAWSAAFDRTGRTWMIHITGGEPTLYPEFAELAALLSRRHYLSLNSNLTGRELAGFAERVDPARVALINAGYHPAERHARRGEDLFLRNAALLRERGFPVMISVVATPEVLADYDSIVAAVAPTGLAPMPKALHGMYRGARHPAAYSDDDRREFRRRSLAAEQGYPNLFEPEGLHPSIDLTRDRAHLDRRVQYVGKPCAAGRDLVRIDPDGSVHRCAIKGPAMGNLLHGTWRQAAACSPCDRSYCVYFCDKYTAKARSEAAASVAAQ